MEIHAATFEGVCQCLGPGNFGGGVIHGTWITNIGYQAFFLAQCTKLIELFNQEPLNETFVLDTENDGKWGSREFWRLELEVFTSKLPGGIPQMAESFTLWYFNIAIENGHLW